MSKLVLDAGAFIAYERGSLDIRSWVVAARRDKIVLTTTSPIIGQVWRDGRRQALLAKLVAATKVDAPSEDAARRAGELLAKARMDDVVGALLVGLTADGDTILTSDSEDIEALVSAARRAVAVVTV